MQARDTTEEALLAHEAVMEHPLDIGSPAAVQQILDGSQESQEEPAAEHAEAAVQEVLATPIAASRLLSLVLFPSVTLIRCPEMEANF